MRLKILIITCVLGIIALSSCKNDDDDDLVEVELQTLSETAIENDAEIQVFLQTHFYNYEEFENAAEDFDFQIVIDTIAGENGNKIAMINQVSDTLITVSSDVFGLDEEEDVAHKLYYLIAHEGDGVKSSVADSTFINFEGLRLDKVVFDSSSTPIWFDLLGDLLTSGGVIEGFQQGISKLKEGGEIVENFDGTFNVESPGTGLIIMPSGLAYFSSTIPGESYAPIMFKINLIRTINADHDRDGIPSLLEDLNGDDDFITDDTDEDGLPNYIDTDDDNDGTLTSDEITINEDGSITFPDTDGDGTPDYLDSDS